MQTQRSSSILIAAGLLTVVLLPSCSLPPGVAWREIQSEGLIPFLKNGMSAPKAQTQSQGLYAAQNGSANKVVEPPQPTLNNVPAKAPAAASTAFPPAYAVAGLSGYVRTPFTNPPRLVDVRGMSPGTKVVCPYTQNPFVVPAAAVSAAPRNPAPQIAASKDQSRPKPQKSAVAPSQSKPVPAPTPTPAVVKTQPAPAPAPAPAPKMAASPKPQPSAPPVSKPQPKETTPQVAATKPAPAKEPAAAPAPAPSKIQTTPPPAPAPPAVAKLPYGTAISGRPGFVNSPYAEKHQLVDVTGLSVGTEVKCPYTGKLFRVPLQQQAKK